MSQFGMQVPGGRVRRGPTADVYSALVVVAAVFLAVACVVMWMAGQRLGPNGNAFGFQEAGKIQLTKPAAGR